MEDGTDSEVDKIINTDIADIIKEKQVEAQGDETKT